MSGDEVDPWFLELADGREPDWTTMESQLAGDPQRLEQLRRAARLVGAMTRVSRGDAGSGDADAAGHWGHLRLSGRLGSGSYGEVFRAFDPVLEREVAVKLRHEKAGGGAAGAFIAEARRLARVRHPHVLAVHGAGVHDGRAGLWCDLIDGRTLSDVVESDGALPWRDLLRHARDLASALAAVHDAELVHGDVKPANVMIERSSGRVVLMDFGSASERELAARVGVAGSPITMAAEQIDGGPVGPAADVYSLGVVMHFMATGRYPLTPTRAGQRGAGQRVDGRQVAAERGRGVPRLLRPLLQRCLADDPAARPEASTVFARLQRLIEAPQRRRRKAALAAVLASLGVALAVSLYALGRVAAERDRALAAQAREAEVGRFLTDMLAAPDPAQHGAEVRVREILDDARGTLDSQFASRPEVRAALLGTVGNSYRALGLLDAAAETLRQSLELARSYAGADSRPALEAELLLAEVRLLAQPGPERLAELEALLGRAGDLLGEGSRPVIAGTLRLAALETEGQAGPAALERVEHLLQLARARPDAMDPSQHSLALSLRARLHMREGEDDAATARLMEALDLLGDDSLHPNAVLARDQLAQIAINRGDLAQAEAMYREMLELVQSRFGETHPDLRVVLSNLGAVLLDQRRFDQALPPLERAAALAARDLGPGHPHTLGIRSNLANVLAETGQLARAGSEREELLELADREFPPSHPHVLIARVNLAEQRLLECRWDEARQLAGQASSSALERFPAGHLFVLEPSEIAVRAGHRQGRPGMVERMERLCAAKASGLGASNPYTLKCDAHLAAMLVDAGRLDEAVARSDALVETSAASHGAEHPLTGYLRERRTRLAEGSEPRCD